MLQGSWIWLSAADNFKCEAKHAKQCPASELFTWLSLVNDLEGKMFQSGGNHNIRFNSTARNTMDDVTQQDLMGTMVPMLLEMGGIPFLVPGMGINHSVPISAFAYALASAPPDHSVCYAW